MEYKIDKSEVRRYLGIKGCADSVTESLIDECIAELTAIVRPKYTYHIFKITHTDKKIHFPECNICLTGNTAKERLCSCDYCVMLGATLGIEADNKIRTAQNINMTKAIIYDACATDLIEKVCDGAQDEIAVNAAKDDLSVTERFSPGYGDLPLDVQKSISAILKLPTVLGVNLTDEFLLIPTKSVTAFIGIGTNAQKGAAGCRSCNMRGSCKFCKFNPKGM